MLQAGTQLHDRYRVLRRIGRGGMGAVYEAVDTRLRNTVAVKLVQKFSGDIFEDDEQVAPIVLEMQKT